MPAGFRFRRQHGEDAVPRSLRGDVDKGKGNEKKTNNLSCDDKKTTGFVVLVVCVVVKIIKHDNGNNLYYLAVVSVVCVVVKIIRHDNGNNWNNLLCCMGCLCCRQNNKNDNGNNLYNLALYGLSVLSSTRTKPRAALRGEGAGRGMNVWDAL